VVVVYLLRVQIIVDKFTLLLESNSRREKITFVVVWILNVSQNLKSRRLVPKVRVLLEGSGNFRNGFW
jgi:hypothetical protein